MSRPSRLRTRQHARPGRSGPECVSLSEKEGRKPHRPNRPAESARAEPALMADQVLPSSVQPAGCIGHKVGRVLFWGIISLIAHCDSPMMIGIGGRYGRPDKPDLHGRRSCPEAFRGDPLAEW